MKKEKQLRIRITEDQLKRLTSQLILNEIKSKSEFVREAIKEKLEKNETHDQKSN